MSSLLDARDNILAEFPDPGYDLDENGNILASVTPRTGALAELLDVSDAGDGEVATVTDRDMRVVYRGNPSVGVPYSRHGAIVHAEGDLGFSFVGSGATATVVISSTYDPEGIVSSGAIALPTGLPFVTGEELTLEMTVAMWSTPGIAVDEVLTLKIEGRDEGDLTWNEITQTLVAPSFSLSIAPSIQISFIIGDFQSRVPGAGGNAIDQIRFIYGNDSAGSASMFGKFQFKVIELGA